MRTSLKTDDLQPNPDHPDLSYLFRAIAGPTLVNAKGRAPLKRVYISL